MREPDRHLDRVEPTPPGVANTRAAFSHLATGVTVLATTDGDHHHGMTVSSLLTLTLDPPRILLSLNDRSITLTAIRRRGAFTVSVLEAGDRYLADRFSTPLEDKFAGLSLTYWSGVPVLRSALAWFGCEVDQAHPVGDHVLVVGRVVAARVGPGEPLIRYRHAYHGIGMPAEEFHAVADR